MQGGFSPIHLLKKLYQNKTDTKSKTTKDIKNSTHAVILRKNGLICFVGHNVKMCTFCRKGQREAESSLKIYLSLIVTCLGHL